MWSPSGGTAATASGLSAGTYTCLITDVNGNTFSQTVTITQPSQINIAVTATPASCSGTGSATANASGGNGPYSYSWSSGGTSNTENNLPIGNYTVTVTDASSCTITQTVSITTAPPPSITSMIGNVTCFGSSNGSASLTISGGVAPFTYSWSPTGGNSSFANGLSIGSYTCTVTDANGCNFTQAVTITQPTAIIASNISGSIVCFGGTTSASVAATGGTPAYSYLWSPSGGTSQNATGISAGSYTCTITDLNGCINQQLVTITQPPNLSVAAISTNLNCFTDQNGTATSFAIGGTPTYTYHWTPTGGNNQIATGLGVGNYVITVTDAAGCITNNTVTISSPPQIVPVVSQNVSPGCYGDCNGIATVTTTGGSGPFTYNWIASGCTTPTCGGLCNGNTSVLITDSLGCTSSIIVVTAQPDSLVASATHTDETWVSNNDGTATAIVNGGTGPYTYVWAPTGGPNATATGLDAGTYTCTITDAHGCTTTVTVTVNTNDQIGITNPESQNLTATIFPNPAKDFVTINVTSNQRGDFSIEVFDIVGQKLDEVDFKNTSEINFAYRTSTLPNGVYLFNIRNGVSKTTKKITVAN